MFRSLRQRFIGGIVNTNIRGSSIVPSMAPVSSGMTNRSNAHPTKSIDFPSALSRRSFHGSVIHLKSVGGVHVTMESGSSPDNFKIEQSTLNIQSDDDSSSESTCSQGIPTNMEEEEDEQEEMFVTADPVLGLGNVQEWGGPRRGGRLEEPTRFGDWERKGRCSDF